MCAHQPNRGTVPCALGIRAHSGWAAAVVVSIENGIEQILKRQRLDIIEARSLGTAQPYHFAKTLGIADAEEHLKTCAETSARLAMKGIQEIKDGLTARGYQLNAAAILLSSGRPLPALPQILLSHPLIHTAEGEFFRQAFRTACEELKIPVTGIRERELDNIADAALGKAAGVIRKRLEDLGRALGPPWTADQKTGAFAALIALAGT
jgi:hypothetical protein